MRKSGRGVLSLQLYGLDPLHRLDIQHFNSVSEFFLFAVLLVAEAPEEDQEGLVQHARLLLILGAIGFRQGVRLGPLPTGHVEHVKIIQNFLVVATVGQDLISVALHDVVGSPVRHHLLVPHLLEGRVYSDYRPQELRTGLALVSQSVPPKM